MPQKTYPEVPAKPEANPHSSAYELKRIAFNRQLSSFYRTSLYYHRNASTTAAAQLEYVVGRVGKEYFPPELLSGRASVGRRVMTQPAGGKSVIDALKAYEQNKDGVTAPPQEAPEEVEDDEQFDDASDFDMAAVDDDEEIDVSEAGDEYD
eukprot:GEMP01071303.1.p1 GENE.GEMP01071303.1~~GEMP01071303.1.p1  ORF type:complete len:151 (+),score=44.29 GEMP01071303.1:402-854(+)